MRFIFYKRWKREKLICGVSTLSYELDEMPSTVSPIENGEIKKNGITKECADTAKEIPGNEDEEDLTCGYGTYRPKWMQVFNTPQALLVFLSFAGFVQGFIVNGVINVNMSTLERRFGFTSSKSGWIASVYDLAAAPMALFVTFMGSVGYKQRWLGSGLIALGVGSFIMALPHFTTDNYYWQKTQAAVCSNKSMTCNADSEQSNLKEYLYVFLLGQVFHSVGGSILYTLGVTCLDDVVKPRTTPLYLGIMMFFATLGPALGYIMGGQFLNIYVDFNTIANPPATMDSKDPQWVGAWWICFLISGTLAIIIGPILLGYAKELPVAKKIRETRENEAHQGHKPVELQDPHQGATLKELPSMCFSLLRNPSFIFVSFASANEGILLSGISTFLPKFIENQFSQTASWASMLAGFVGISGAAGGQFLGGYLCKRLGLNVSGKCRLSIVTLCLGLFMSAAFWAKCDKVKFAGISVPYSESSMALTGTTSSLPLADNPVDATCNNLCHCNEEYFNPVCGSDGIQYFSSCHAGCMTYNKTGKVYHNCACISPLNKTAKHEATEGVCPKKTCIYLHIALFILFFFIITTFLAQTPIIAIILRCVPDNHRTFGVGLANFISRIFGTLPGPLLFGFAIDKSCMVWKKSSCAEELSCWIYKDRTLSRNFFILVVVVRTFSILFMVLANYLYKPPTQKVQTVIGESQAYVNPVATEGV